MPFLFLDEQADEEPVKSRNSGAGSKTSRRDKIWRSRAVTFCPQAMPRESLRVHQKSKPPYGGFLLLSM